MNAPVRSTIVEAAALRAQGVVLAELRRLRDRVEELEDIVGLKAAARFPAPMSPQQREILGILLTRAIAMDALIAALYGRRPECDQPDNPSRVIFVQLTRLRAALAPHRLAILCQPQSCGNNQTLYFMTASDRARAKALMGEA